MSSLSLISFPNPDDPEPIGPWGPWIRPQELTTAVYANVLAAGVLTAVTLRRAFGGAKEQTVAASVASAASALIDDYCGTPWRKGPFPHGPLTQVLVEFADATNDAAAKKDLISAAELAHRTASPIR